MRPQHVVLLASLLVVTIGAPAVLAAQRRDRAIEGVWRYVEEVDRRADGSVVRTSPTGGYDGLLIFTPSGYMSATLMPKGRTWRHETVTPAEVRATFEAASSHAGRYKPNPMTHVVRMENLVTIDPNDEGKWDDIRYRVQRDTLELSGPWTYNGEKITFTLRMARVK